MENQQNYTKKIFYVLLFMAVILMFALLKVTADFILTIFISVMLSLVLYPFIKKLNSFHIPWTLGILITVIIALGIFFVFTNILTASLKTIINAYPNYESKFLHLWELFAKTLNIEVDENQSIFSRLWGSLGIRTAIQNMAISLSSFLVSTVQVTALVVLLVVFLMIEMSSVKDKIRTAFPQENINRRIIFVVIKIISEVTRYVSIKFLVSLGTGICVLVSTTAIGMDFPVIWAFIAFVLNFIPTFGSMISCGATIGFAVIQFYPDITPIIILAIIMVGINFVFGNIVEPKWEGSDLGISPFVILVSLSLWSYIWGFIGMILAVPMMVIIKIICENIDFLKPVAVLIGGSTKKAARHEADRK